MIECPNCNGEGVVYDENVTGGPNGPIYFMDEFECETCNSTGEIEEEK